MQLLPRRRPTSTPTPTTTHRPRRRRRTLTAAAQPANRQNASSLRRLHQPWQQRFADYYDTLPEAWYPCQFYARSLQRTRLYPAILNQQGEPEEVDSGPLVDLFERIQDPGGGERTELAAAYGRLMFGLGDGYLTVTQEDGQEAWEFLSPLELKLKPHGRPDRPQDYVRLRAPGMTPEELSEAGDDAFDVLPGEARVYRFWRRHPIWTAQADSPVRAVLDLYELLHRLTMAPAAEASSRAANRGMFFVPQEVTFVSLDPADQEDPEEDPFLAALLEGLAANVRDPNSAEAMAPFVVRGPVGIQVGDKVVPTKDAMGWIAMGPQDRYLEGELWEKVIGRIANGLDLPKAVVTGEARNHWGDWAIDEQGYRLHVAPVTVGLCENLNTAYLRPAAEEAGIPDADRVVIWFDPAEAINHPDQIGTAKDAHDRLVISDAAYRDAGGFTEDDAPDEDEYVRRLFVKLGEVPVDLAPEPAGETAPDDGGRGGDVDEAPPELDQPSANGGGPEPVTASAVQVARIIGAAEAWVDRVRERAGARLARRAQSCEPCRLAISGVPKDLAAAVLGRDTVLEVIDGHASESALVDDAAKPFAEKLRGWGVQGAWPDDLASLVEQHALRTLYERDPPPLPTGFAAAVAKAVR